MIKCKDRTDWKELVSWCVRKGLTFEADYDTLTITLTGGY